MTKDELSQLFYLNKEISNLKGRIAEVEEVATSANGSEITGMPHGAVANDKIGDFAAELADLQALLQLKIKQCFFELNILTRFINGIKDSEMRQILTLRYINGFSWQKIAFDIGHHDEQIPRKKHNRFLKQAAPKTKMDLYLA